MRRRKILEGSLFMAAGLLVRRLARAAEPVLLAPGAKLEKLVGDLQFSEGPAWHPSGYLLFEDIPKKQILRLDAKNKVSVFREASGGANGLAFDKQGRVVACEGDERRISLREKDGKVITLADRYDGKRLNSPNDLTIDAKGRIYFTDPRYGKRDGMELDKEAVYRIDPDRKITRIIDSVTRPNGIALSGDQKTLFLADNEDKDTGAKRVLLAFDLAPDGNASNKRELHDFGTGRGIDGMTVDTAGRIWASAGRDDQAGIYVFQLDRARATAKLLTVIKTPESPTNCTFGGQARDWLYITTDKALYRIKTTAKGKNGLPGK